MHIRGRRKVKVDEPTKDLDAFIQRVERVSNIRRNATEQWGKTDVLHLLSRICLLENQDVASFLPQAVQQPIKASPSDYKSVLDPKVIWDTSGAQMGASQAVAGTQNLQTVPAAASLVRVPVLVDEENQYIGELMVSDEWSRTILSLTLRSRCRKSWRSIWVQPITSTPTGRVSCVVEQATHHMKH